MTQFKRLIDAYLQGYITLAERNAYLNAGKTLDDIIEVSDTPEYPEVGDLDMETYKVINLGVATAETDGAALSNVRHRIVSKTFTHDGGAVTVVTVPAKSRVTWVYFVITEAFDGSLKLGDTDDDDRLMLNTEIEKTAAAHGPTHIHYDYAASKAILITPSGGTTGEGTIYLAYEILP